MASTYVKELTDGDLTQEQLPKEGAMLVDFWAPWCAPCRMVAPIVDQLAEEMNGKLEVGKLNIDEHSEAAMRYGVASIPTLILFKDGQEVERVVGARNKAFLAEAIARHL